LGGKVKTEPYKDPHKCEHLGWTQSKAGKLKYFCKIYEERDAQCRLFPLASFPEDVGFCPASNELLKKLPALLKKAKK
jgi:Fe-S-cluster containining protein